MSAIDTLPPSAEQATTETLPWGFDFAPLLLVGETISAVTATIVNRSTGLPAGTLSAPSVTANVATVGVPGSLLAAGTEYDVLVSAQAAAGKIWTMRLRLVCPE